MSDLVTVSVRGEEQSKPYIDVRCRAPEPQAENGPKMHV